MYLLGCALLLTVLKLLDVGPVAGWSWWPILSLYVATAIWWAVADNLGFTQRRAAQRMEQRKQKRVQKQKDAMGIRDRR